MATPVSSRPPSKRFLGNSDSDKHEVHDLRNENTNCQISEILNAVVFSPDTLQQARSEGYDPCYWCLSGSTR